MTLRHTCGKPRLLCVSHSRTNDLSSKEGVSKWCKFSREYSSHPELQPQGIRVERRERDTETQVESAAVDLKKITRGTEPRWKPPVAIGPQCPCPLLFQFPLQYGWRGDRAADLIEAPEPAPPPPPQTPVSVLVVLCFLLSLLWVWQVFPRLAPIPYPQCIDRARRFSNCIYLSFAFTDFCWLLPLAPCLWVWRQQSHTQDH